MLGLVDKSYNATDRPQKAISCFICGGEYATQFLPIHLQTCEKRMLSERRILSERTGQNLKQIQNIIRDVTQNNFKTLKTHIRELVTSPRFTKEKLTFFSHIMVHQYYSNGHSNSSPQDSNDKVFPSQTSLLEKVNLQKQYPSSKQEEIQRATMPQRIDNNTKSNYDQEQKQDIYPPPIKAQTPSSQQTKLKMKDQELVNDTRAHITSNQNLQQIQIVIKDVIQNNFKQLKNNIRELVSSSPRFTKEKLASFSNIMVHQYYTNDQSNSSPQDNNQKVFSSQTSLLDKKNSLKFYPTLQEQIQITMPFKIDYNAKINNQQQSKIDSYPFPIVKVLTPRSIQKLKDEEKIKLVNSGSYDTIERLEILRDQSSQSTQKNLNIKQVNPNTSPQKKNIEKQSSWKQNKFYMNNQSEKFPRDNLDKEYISIDNVPKKNKGSQIAQRVFNIITNDQQ